MVQSIFGKFFGIIMMDIYNFVEFALQYLALFHSWHYTFFQLLYPTVYFCQLLLLSALQPPLEVIFSSPILRSAFDDSVRFFEAWLSDASEKMSVALIKFLLEGAVPKFFLLLLQLLYFLDGVGGFEEYGPAVLVRAERGLLVALLRHLLM